jgi:hypothetical protein
MTEHIKDKTAEAIKHRFYSHLKRQINLNNSSTVSHTLNLADQKLNKINKKSFFSHDDNIKTTIDLVSNKKDNKSSDSSKSSINYNQSKFKILNERYN